MRLVGVLLVLSLFISADDPPCKCNLLLYRNWNEHTSMRTIDKEIKKMKRHRSPRNYYREADIYFVKAWKLHKEGNDSLAASYFKQCNILFEMDRCGRNVNLRASLAFKQCILFYYLGNYKESVRFYEYYTRIVKLPTTCPEIYYLESLKKLYPNINIDSVKHVIANDDSHKLNELNNCSCF